MIPASLKRNSEEDDAVESNDPSNMTFWDHVDELRKVLFRIIGVVVAFMLLAFCFKEELFSIVLAPKENDFPVYRLFDWIGEVLHLSGTSVSDFHVQLINTKLSGQFLTHMSVSFYAGIILASLIGVLFSYFLIFPFTFRFLALYQVSAEVENAILLSSYIETLVMLSIMLGITFEIPVLAWLFAKLGFLTSSFMRTYRKHALIVTLIIAAIITPTSDAITLLLVSAPMFLLYEARYVF